MLLRIETGLEQLNDRGVVGGHLQFQDDPSKRRNEEDQIKPETEDETEN